MSKLKEQLLEALISLIKKKTIYMLIFTILAILAIRADFSCGWKAGNFDFHFEVKNLDKKIPGE